MARQHPHQPDDGRSASKTPGEDRTRPVRGPYGRAVNGERRPSDGERVDPASTSPAKDANASGIYANDSLADKTRNPAIPSPNLVFPAALVAPSALAAYGTDTGVAGACNNQQLSKQITVEFFYDEDVLPELSTAAFYLEQSDDDMRFIPAVGSATTRERVCFTAGGEDYLAHYLRDCELTQKLIAWEARWNREMRDLTKGTVDRQQQLLLRFFANPCIPDPVLGLRPPTAREVLEPHLGRVIVLRAREALADFPTGVMIDFLNAVRRFARFVSENGAALPSGENVALLWGRLACPIDDRDIPKRKPKRGVLLPSIELMDAIYDAIVDWAERQRKQVTAWRTAALVIVCFESGLRGVEARGASLSDQVFDRSGRFDALPNRLAIHGAKGGPDRLVEVDRYGFEFLRFWLEEWRPRLVGDDLFGPVFPSSTGQHRPIGSSSLTETARPLFENLKRLGLLHESFSFHATRKTYTTHFLEKDGLAVGRLLDQCGWSSPAQLPVYVLPSANTVADQRRQFSRTLGRRSGR